MTVSGIGTKYLLEQNGLYVYWCKTEKGTLSGQNGKSVDQHDYKMEHGDVMTK